VPETPTDATELPDWKQKTLDRKKAEEVLKKLNGFKTLSFVPRRAVY
jgi:hypothetical protein